MQDERDDEATPPTWHATMQESFRDADPLDWQMCCVARVVGHDPLVVAAGLLADHPDSPTMVKRAMLFANQERQGPVWRVSHTSADFFNPYTGETVEHVMLPIPVAPQGNPALTLDDIDLDDPANYKKAEGQTAAGLRWAEAIRSVPTDARGEIPWRTRVLGVQEQFSTPPGDVKHPSEVVEDAAPQQIPFDYEPNVIATGRILDEAVKAATAYTLAHHGSGDWTRVEECLSPVATAAAAFVAAYTMWRFNG